jgi:hypothetical protein
MTDKEEIVEFDATKLTNLCCVRKNRNNYRAHRPSPRNHFVINASAFNMFNKASKRTPKKSKDSTLSTETITPTNGWKKLQSSIAITAGFNEAVRFIQLRKCQGDSGEL